MNEIRTILKWSFLSVLMFGLTVGIGLLGINVLGQKFLEGVWTTISFGVSLFGVLWIFGYLDDPQEEENDDE